VVREYTRFSPHGSGVVCCCMASCAPETWLSVCVLLCYSAISRDQVSSITSALIACGSHADVSHKSWDESLVAHPMNQLA